MKVLVLLALLGSVTAQAAPQDPQVPMVVCSFEYSQLNSDGSTKEVKRGPRLQIGEEGSKVNFKEFLVQGTLRRVCAADGGPCTNSYDLTVTISRGKAQSFIETRVAKGDWSSLATALQAGHEQVYGGCDINEMP